MAASRADRGSLVVFGLAATAAIEREEVELPDGVEVVSDGSVAAVVAAASNDGLRGAAALRRHDAVMNRLVSQRVTILPMRFGTVMPDAAVVVRDLLQRHRNVLQTALTELDGQIQYLLRVDYVRDAVVRAVAQEDEHVIALRSVPRNAQTGEQAQIRLGEAVVAAIDRRRAEHAGRISDSLATLASRIECTLAQHPDRLANFACLVSRENGTAFERGVEALAKRHHAAVHMTLLGPLAPYDFVPKLR